MSTALWLALLDAVAGVYLVVYALRRERRDKPVVLVTGLFLLVCAAALGWLRCRTRRSQPLGCLCQSVNSPSRAGRSELPA